MDMQKYNNLKKRLNLDAVNIDKDLVELPMIIQEASELFSEVQNEYNVADHAYDVILAETAQDLRNVDGRAPSETQIQARVPLSELVQDARNIRDNLKTELAQVKALVENLRDANQNLKTVGQLIMAGFISPNSVYKRKEKG